MKKTDDENSRARIFEAATKLFAQKGYDSTSIRDICKEAGVNVCMISYYFGGKHELYNGIISDLIERQITYVKGFLDLKKPITEYSKKEQIDLLFLYVDKFVDFFYSNISRNLIIILLKEQQKSDCNITRSPGFMYLLSLIANIFEKPENDREIIFKTLFIICQINSPRILPAISLRRLGQDDFTQEDIKIIKDNLKFYINAILKEAKIV